MVWAENIDVEIIQKSEIFIYSIEKSYKFMYYYINVFLILKETRITFQINSANESI